MAIHTIELGGTRLHCRTEGVGSPLLLVHGFPLDHTMWDAQIDQFSNRHQIIAPDLPGFGQSGSIEGTYLMSDFADDLAKLLDALNVNQPIIYCGLSMGGYIGWEFWSRHRDRLRALVVCDSRCIADDEVTQKARDVAASRVLNEGTSVVSDSMLPRLFGDRFRENAPREVDRIKRVMDLTAPATMAAALRGMARRRDFTSELPRIDIPTLVVCGEHDAISPAEEMSGFAATIPGAEYVQIDDAGHMAPMEDTAAVNAVVGAFLAAHEDGG